MLSLSRSGLVQADLKVGLYADEWFRPT